MIKQFHRPEARLQLILLNRLILRCEQEECRQIKRISIYQDGLNKNEQWLRWQENWLSIVDEVT